MQSVEGARKLLLQGAQGAVRVGASQARLSHVSANVCKMTARRLVRDRPAAVASFSSFSRPEVKWGTFVGCVEEALDLVEMMTWVSHESSRVPLEEVVPFCDSIASFRTSVGPVHLTWARAPLPHTPHHHPTAPLQQRPPTRTSHPKKTSSTPGGW